MPKSNIAKFILIVGIVVVIVDIIANIDSTLYYNATQYVAEGEKPEPVRMTELMRDVVGPFYSGAVLYALAWLVDRKQAK